MGVVSEAKYFEAIPKECLDSALKNAKTWCSTNLPKYLRGFRGADYGVFKYVVDDEIIDDMLFEKTEPAVIHVSPKRIQWYQGMGHLFKERGIEFMEFDIESVFVHEIVESIISFFPGAFDPELYEYVYFYKTHGLGRGHDEGIRMQNINRAERGLNLRTVYNDRL